MMREKTAEEKLREELEGKSSEGPQEKSAGTSELERKPVKPRAMRSRAAVRKTKKPVNVGQRVDSFMEDFERRIAESLSAGNIFSGKGSESEKVSAEEASAVKTVRRRRRKIEEPSVMPKPENVERDVLGLETIPEASQPAPESEAIPEISQPTPEPEATPESSQPAPESEAIPESSQPAPESEDTPEIAQLAPVPEDTPEIAQLAPESEATPEIAQPIPEQEAIPEISQPALESEDTPAPETTPDPQNTIPVEILNPSEQDFDDAFPNIPVIDAQEIAQSSESSEQNSLPDIPVITPEPVDFDDDFHNFTEESQDTSQAPQNASEFPPFADVVVNVDDDLPQIHSDSPDSHAENPDPENEAAPVSVTMPESTKTAEDKLMANIAEAMTGSPLTLDKPDPSEPYRLPENLLNAQNDPNSSPQSAEDKLIADISQAISESPIETAQNQANQNFEDELSPFDEMPLPEPIQTPDFDDDLEQQEEGVDFDEPFLPDFPQETEQQEQPQENSLAEDFTEDIDAEDMPDFSELPISEDDTVLDEGTAEFSGFSDAVNLEKTPEPEQELVPEFEPSPTESELVPEFEPSPTESELMLESEPSPIESELTLESEPSPIESELMPEFEPSPTESEPVPESDSQPLTAEDRLAQEIADFTNHDATHDQQQDTEPEQSLLDEPNTSDDDLGEDFNFMDSWGDAASIMNYGDDEPEHDTVTHEDNAAPHEDSTDSQDTFSQKEIPPAPAIAPKTRITHAPQKSTVQDSHEEPATSPIWRILLQAVLGLLILAGLFSLFKLHQLTDNITAMMLYGNNQPDFSAHSYDYAIDKISDEEISSRMRLRGIEGWKLVGSRRTQDTSTNRYGYEFIFMRASPANF